ncbi:hypothetical protein G6O69_00750 [Pseudenhygromyxa sp. WMMC2535]|uniref:gp53-like domain-containing protein n=1 Tax=Pseudenhygromyxa sp. WMMC2535 TaxID=2712867 RepID=UPI0015538977|nr:hypothetical protein [Pseudenhygromyxa sp. WMMC2535]NVB36338.1 hypothetical protein [Pseudenhygromyxa sp. WMMC2535]
MTATRFTIKTDAGYYYNGFHDAAVVGNLMFQWGQHNSTLDTSQAFALHQSFGSRCYALLTSCSRQNVWSALALASRGRSSFTVDRDGAIDGNYPFYWLAIGDAPGTSIAAPHYATLGDSVITWNDALSDYDGNQVFTTPTALGGGTSAAVLTVTEANIRSALGMASFDGPNRKLTLNRHNDVNGGIDFNYVAMGAKPGKTATGVQQIGDLKLQWGRATTNSDYEQAFSFPEPFEDMNFAVITALQGAGSRAIVSQTRPVNARSFIVDRDASIDGSYGFHWLAIGR